MPGDNIIIGGVSFRKRDVKSSEIKYQGGTNMNTVFLRDGTKIQFNDQTTENARVIIGTDTVNGKHGIKFSNVSLFSLQGTDNKDYYYLNNSSVHSFDLSGDTGNSDELRFVYDNKTRKHLISPRYANYDTDDKITDINRSNGCSISEGVWIPDNN